MAKRYDAQRQRWDDDAQSDAAAAARWLRLQRVSMLSTAGVLLAYALGFATWRGIERHNAEVAAEKAHASASASARAEASRSAREQASAEATARADAIANPSDATVAPTPPSGYERSEDIEGWTIDVPEGWTREVEERLGQATVVTYEKAGDGQRLQVFPVEDASPYQSVLLADEYLGGGAAKDYVRVDLVELRTFDSLDPPSARLEYTFTDKKTKDTRRTVDVRFEAANDQYYAVAATGPADQDTAVLDKVVKAALVSFCPSDTTCAPA